MKALTPLLGLALAASLVAQSPLTTQFGWTNGYTAIATGRNVYFDLQVNNQITIQSLELNTQSAIGTNGSLEVWIGNPGITSYLGNEQIAANWTLTSTGTLTANAQNTPTPVCLVTPITLAPGNYAIALKYTGISAVWTAGTGSALPGSGNQSFTNADVVVKCGSAQATPFGAASVPVNNVIWNGALHYFPGVTSTPCSALPATSANYGEGCQRFLGSFWSTWAIGGTAATASTAASAVLTNRALSWIPGGGGAYSVLNNLGGVAFVTPPGTATALATFVPDNDDGEMTVNLTTPFPAAAGAVNTLNVHNNGIVSLGAIDASIAPSWAPFVGDLLNAPVTAWYCWHDFNILEVGSGQIKFHENAGVAYITWEGVESYPNGGVPNPSTVQFQFDSNTGQVNLVCGTISTAGIGNNISDAWLVGYSPAGTSVDHGNTNLATLSLLAIDGTLDRLPLALAASTRPVMGANIVFRTTNPTTPPLPNLPIGSLLFSLADLPGFSPVGIDLAIIGAPGCFVNVDPTVSPLSGTLSTLPGFSMDFTLAVPVVPSAAGLSWYVQSIWLDPSVNAFGLLTSNAVKQTVGTW